MSSTVAFIFWLVAKEKCPLKAYFLCAEIWSLNASVVKNCDVCVIVYIFRMVLSMISQSSDIKVVLIVRLFRHL